MGDSDKVECASHGWQAKAYACQHIVESLRTGVPVGFHWPEDQFDPHPDAWCTDCEERRLAAGGEWTPEVEAQLRIKLICGACYERAKSIWDKGRKVNQ